MVNIVLNDNEIKNTQVKELLKSMSETEIKRLFLHFLEKRLPQNQNRWQEFTKSIEELKVSNISDKVTQASNELRESFELRESNE